jgi:CRP/FNR family cyclic AMP-dependent transcriptional regulator
MAGEANIELLQAIPIFNGLSTSQLAMILGAARKVFFTEGQPIIEQGQSGETAYVILSGGAVSRLADSPHEDVLLPGAMIGELAMLVEMTYAMTVTATERVRALAISRGDLYAVMDRDPALAQHFADKLMQRLLDLADELRAVDEQFAAIEASLEQAGQAA